MKKTIHIQYGEEDIHEKILNSLTNMDIIEFKRGGNQYDNKVKKFGTLIIEFIED